MLAQSSPEDIEKLKDEEYDQLLSFILASNKGIDEFLREVEDSEKWDILIESLKEEVNS